MSGYRGAAAYIKKVARHCFKQKFQLSDILKFLLKLVKISLKMILKYIFSKSFKSSPKLEYRSKLKNKSSAHIKLMIISEQKL